jgi:hypothetical protein
MTPKEKAKELVSKFNFEHTGQTYILYQTVDESKRCALICCEEMIKEPRMFDSEQVKYSDGSYARSYYEVPNKFWQQVKNEIEKL